MSNEQLIWIKQLVFVIAFFLAVVALLVYSYRQQVKSVFAAFKRLPLVVAVLVWFGIED